MRITATRVHRISEIKKLRMLPDMRKHVRDLMKKYGVRSIDVINAIKKGLAIARRKSLDTPFDTFYQLIEKVFSSCLKSDDSGSKFLDTTCFEEKFQILLEQPGEELKKIATADELITRLDELRQPLVDYCLRLGDRESIDEFFSYLEQWVKNVREEVEVWLSIRESISRKGVDYAKIVREMRSLRG